MYIYQDGDNWQPYLLLTNNIKNILENKYLYTLNWQLSYSGLMATDQVWIGLSNLWADILNSIPSKF